jgi:hypothetical protein
MKDLIETIEYKGYDIEIGYDDLCESPIKDEYCSLPDFVTWHRHYELGNMKFADKESFLNFAKTNKCRIYPLYLYDHSGLTISLSPFSCPWDSGQVGWVMLQSKKVREWFGVKRLSKKIWNLAEESVKVTVEMYDDYLRGNCYWYQVLKDGDVVDSCGGFIGDTKEVIESAQAVIDDIGE